MIVSPAIKTGDGTIWSTPAPSNHGYVCEKIAKTIGYVINDDSDPAATARWDALMKVHEMGFLTDQGIFLGRREAWTHARAAGQRSLYHPNGMPEDGGLSSEDLWGVLE
jgi:hypothetical protein